MNTDDRALADPYCLCCCQPKSRHIAKDLQCPQTVYFIENAPPAAVGERGWLSGYSDYLADPAGLERMRQTVIDASDRHEMAPINLNSLARLIDTIDNLRAALQSPPPVVSGEAIETAAIQLWHRWGSPDQLEWEDEPHKSEYRLAAKNILRALPTVSPFERAAQIAETFRPRGENAKHFVDQLVCDIAAAIRQEASNA